MQKELLALGIAAFTCLGAAEGVMAANPVYDLDTVVVTATTTPNAKQKANASMSVVTGEEIQQKHYQTLKEVMENLPGVNSVAFADGTGFEISGESSLTMRGTSQVVVAVDGVVQHGYKNYLLHLNPDDIERVEVLNGASSTLYGADAVGGVVNIITKKNYTGQHGSISGYLGKFGQRNLHVNTNGGNDKTFYSISYDKQKKDNYKDGFGDRIQRNKDADTVNLKWGSHISDTTDFVLTYADTRENGFAAYKVPHSSNSLWSTDYKFQVFGASLNYTSKDGKTSNVLSYRYGKNRTYRERSKSDKLVPWEISNRDYVSITDRFYKQVSDNNRISAGWEWQRNSVAPSTYWGAVPVNQDRKMREHAFYIQDEWNVTDRMKLTAGLRYVDPDKFKNQWIDSWNISYGFGHDVTLYASSNKFYKTPSTAAVFGNGGPTTGFFPNPSIKPETGRDNEIGLNMNLGKRSRLSMAYFDRRHKNAIVIKNLNLPNSSKNIYTNIDGASHVKGAEISFSQEFNDFLTFKAGFSRLIADKESQIPRLAKTQYNFSLNYDREKYNIGIEAVNRSDFAPNNYFPEGMDNFLPEKNYWVWNVSTNYHLNDTVTVFAKVYNLFDKGYMSATQYNKYGADYGEPWKWYTAPGRSFIIGAEYKF